jgi:hypothetical protein
VKLGRIAPCAISAGNPSEPALGSATAIASCPSSVLLTGAGVFGNLGDHMAAYVRHLGF